MEMEHGVKGAGEDKDVLANRANKLCTQKGYDKLSARCIFTRGELTETIKFMSAQKIHDKDYIVLHFNRYQDMAKMQQFTDHVATHKFPTRIAAKSFIEHVIREACERVPAPSKTWHTPKRLAINDFIIITADGPSSLEDIMETNIPKSFKLPPPYDQYAAEIMAFHWGSHPQINSRSTGKQLSDEDREKYAPEPRLSKKPVRAPKSAAQPKAAVTRTPKPADGDSVSLAAICASLKIDPKEARGALRKASYPKPSNGWQWPKEQKEKVSKDVNAAVMKARKK